MTHHDLEKLNAERKRRGLHPLTHSHVEAEQRRHSGDDESFNTLLTTIVVASALSSMDTPSTPSMPDPTPSPSMPDTAPTPGGGDTGGGGASGSF